MRQPEPRGPRSAPPCTLPPRAAEYVAHGSPGAVAAGVICGFLVPFLAVGLGFWLVLHNIMRRRQAFFVPEVAARRERRRREQRRQETLARRSARRLGHTLSAGSARSWADSALAETPTAAPPAASPFDDSVHAGAEGLARSSASSAGGSGTGVVLLRAPAALTHSASGASAVSSEGEGRRKKSRWLRLKRRLLRWVIKPLFGYDPAKDGQWISPHGYDVRWACALLGGWGLPGAGVPACLAGGCCAVQALSRRGALPTPPALPLPFPLSRPSFVAKFGVMFETSRGPEGQWR